MSMDLKNFFDLDKVNFSDSELELPYEESLIGKGKMKIIELRELLEEEGLIADSIEEIVSDWKNNEIEVNVC